MPFPLALSLSLSPCFSWSSSRFYLCRSLFHSFSWFLFWPWDNICYFVLGKNSSGENKKLKCFDFGEFLAFSFIVWIHKTLFFNLLIGFKLKKGDGGRNVCVKHHCKKCNFRALSDVGWPVSTAVVFISLLRVSDNHKFQIGIQAPVDESKTFFLVYSEMVQSAMVFCVEFHKFILKCNYFVEITNTKFSWNSLQIERK